MKGWRKFFFIHLTLLICFSVIPAEATSPDPNLGLTNEEKAFLSSLEAITMCVDPDWPPYEVVDAAGNFSGIAADLVTIVSERLGVPFVVLPTADWAETIECSKAGKCHLIPFLNQTVAREEWLIFTEPLFVDPNVFITREEHPFIANPGELVNKTIALPEGTSIEEWIRRDYPNLTVITTKDEIEAFRLVERGTADMTLRSLMIAAYTIRSEGFFNLKISGEIPAYTNNLRMGVLKEEVMLRDILNKVIATITPQEREEIINRHVYIKMDAATNYRLLLGVGFSLVLLFLGLFSMLLYRERRKLAINLVERTRELAESEARYKQLSGLDSLTGLNNRRRFDEVFDEEWQRAVRHSNTLSLIMIDLDYFKAYNDNYGHLNGDNCLVAIAQALDNALQRSTDFVCRFGGEEFCIILPETGADEAVKTGELIRNTIESLKVDHAYSPIGPFVTISAGVATVIPLKGTSMKNLLETADQALYEAKAKGRNRVVLISLL